MIAKNTLVPILTSSLIASAVSIAATYAIVSRAPTADSITQLEASPESMEGRIAMLEQAMDDLALERIDLAARIQGLEEGTVASVETYSPPRQVADIPETRERPNPARLSRREQLQQAGIAEETIDSILRQESERQMQGLQRRYAANRRALESGRRKPYRNEMREQLGDDQYDRYLYASGRSNRVAIAQVLSGSAAETASFESGDIILRYDDQRVFNMAELNQLTYEGSAGELVEVSVQKADGSTQQMYIPRGPLGIRGSNDTKINPDS